MQVRISATVDPAHKAFIQRIAEQFNLSQSEMIERAIELLQKQITWQQMREGYLVDNDEAVQFANQSTFLIDFLDERS